MIFFDKKHILKKTLYAVSICCLSMMSLQEALSSSRTQEDHEAAQSIVEFSESPRLAVNITNKGKILREMLVDKAKQNRAERETFAQQLNSKYGNNQISQASLVGAISVIRNRSSSDLKQVLIMLVDGDSHKKISERISGITQADASYMSAVFRDITKDDINTVIH